MMATPPWPASGVFGNTREHITPPLLMLLCLLFFFFFFFLSSRGYEPRRSFSVIQLNLPLSFSFFLYFSPLRAAPLLSTFCFAARLASSWEVLSRLPVLDEPLIRRTGKKKLVSERKREKKTALLLSQVSYNSAAEKSNKLPPTKNASVLFPSSSFSHSHPPAEFFALFLDGQPLQLHEMKM